MIGGYVGPASRKHMDDKRALWNILIAPMKDSIPYKKKNSKHMNITLYSAKAFCSAPIWCQCMLPNTGAEQIRTD